MNILQDIKVGVLGGGVSSERQISLISAQEAFKSFQRNNIEAVFIDIDTAQKAEVIKLISSQNINLAFIALHGEFGEDGKIQSILQELGIVYTGSGPRASYLAMNKIFSKKIFIKENIPTADFRVYEKGEEIPKNIKYPAVVKPYFAGSSLGVSIVSGPKDLPQALKVAISLQDKAIIEDYIDGKELTVGILGSIPLGVVEIIPKKGYYDFSAKYSDAQTQFIAPARLEKNIYERVQDVALGAHLALGCRGFSRVDMRLNSRNEISVLEVNSIPGLTSHSLLPISASVCGISFDELILTMVKLSLNERTIVEEARKK